MRRKTTLLEENLYFLGYRLDHKTYSGKKSDKVFQYVYIKENLKNGKDYYVNLNRERTKIESFGFISTTITKYNELTISVLVNEYDSMRAVMESIYDFEKEDAKTIETIDLEEANDPFVEESVFDD